jgi:hypothetical protein
MSVYCEHPAFNVSTMLTLQTQQSTSLQIFTAKMAAHVDRWVNLMTS